MTTEEEARARGPDETARSETECSLMIEWEARLRERGLMRDTIRKKMYMARAALAFARDHNWPEDPALFSDEHIKAYQESLSNRSLPTQMFYAGNLKQLIEWAKSKAPGGPQAEGSEDRKEE